MFDGGVCVLPVSGSVFVFVSVVLSCLRACAGKLAYFVASLCREIKKK